jgi:hypothetical protein
LPANRLQISRCTIGICFLLHCLFLLTLHNKDPTSVDHIEYGLFGYSTKVSSLSFTEGII